MSDNCRVVSVSTGINVRSHLMVCGSMGNERSSAYCPGVSADPMFRPGMSWASRHARCFCGIRFRGLLVSLGTRERISRSIYSNLYNVTNVISPIFRYVNMVT